MAEKKNKIKICAVLELSIIYVIDNPDNELVILHPSSKLSRLCLYLLQKFRQIDNRYFYLVQTHFFFFFFNTDNTVYFVFIN